MNETQRVFNYKSKIYIAKKLPSIYDDDENEITQYDEPVKYIFNVQPSQKGSDTKEFGENETGLLVAVIPKAKYKGRFKEFDLVYIDTTPEGENINGENADYRIFAVRNQNVAIRLYFKKLV